MTFPHKATLLIILVFPLVAVCKSQTIFTFKASKRSEDSLSEDQQQSRESFFGEDGKVRGYLTKINSTFRPYFSGQVPDYLMIVVTESKIDPVTKQPSSEHPHIHMMLYNIKVSSIHEGIDIEEQRNVAEIIVQRYETCYQLKDRLVAVSHHGPEEVKKVEKEICDKQCKQLSEANAKLLVYSDAIPNEQEKKTLSGELKFQFVFYNNPFPGPGFRRKVVERKLIGRQEYGIPHYIYFGRKTGIDIAYEENEAIKGFKKWYNPINEPEGSEMIFSLVNSNLLI